MSKTFPPRRSLADKPLFFRHRTNTLSSATGEDGSIWTLQAIFLYLETKTHLQPNQSYSGFTYHFQITKCGTQITIPVYHYFNAARYNIAIKATPRTSIKNILDQAGPDLLDTLVTNATLSLEYMNMRDHHRYLLARKSSNLDKLCAHKNEVAVQTNQDQILSDALVWNKLRMTILSYKDKQVALFAFRLLQAETKGADYYFPPPTADRYISAARLALF